MPNELMPPVLDHLTPKQIQQMRDGAILHDNRPHWEKVRCWRYLHGVWAEIDQPVEPSKGDLMLADSDGAYTYDGTMWQRTIEYSDDPDSLYLDWPFLSAPQCDTEAPFYTPPEKIILKPGDICDPAPLRIQDGDEWKEKTEDSVGPTCHDCQGHFDQPPELKKDALGNQIGWVHAKGDGCKKVKDRPLDAIDENDMRPLGMRRSELL